jgi:hypothetical protein
MPYDYNFTRSGPRQGCLICGNNKKGCSWNSNTVFCKYQENNRPNYGLWTTYQHPNPFSPAGYGNYDNVTIADLRPRAVQQQQQQQTTQPVQVTASPATKPEVVPLPDDTKDRLNRRLLELCQLSDKHRAYLEGEGVAHTASCGSLSYKKSFGIATQLVKEFGVDVCRRYPALVLVKDKTGTREWWAIPAAANGILFPETNVDGYITGLQIRKDVPAGKDDRYRQLSHGGLGGVPLSVFKARSGTTGSNHLLVTEGFKKASAGSEYWQCHTISLAGVNGYNPEELIRTVAILGVEIVSLAFDADKRTNPNVARAEQRMLNILAAAFPKLTIFRLEWGDGTTAKGLDDAIKAGCEFKFIPAANTGSRLVNDLPASVHARNFTNTRKMHTVDEVRTLHRQFFDRLLSAPDGSQTALTSLTGTGKSTAADNSLAFFATMRASGMLRGRWLILAPNKANIDERTRPGTELGKAVASGYVAIQQGRRQIDLGDPNLVQSPFDCANQNADIAGKNRQVTAQVVCPTCPFGSEENWRKAFPDGSKRPWKCEQDGYLASRENSETAPVVIATKETVLNNSNLIDNYDGVIVDEELTHHLIEIVQISSATLDGWRHKIAAKGLVALEWERLFQVINRACATLAGQTAGGSAGVGGDGRLVDAPEHMQTAATALGYDYNQILTDCHYYRHYNNNQGSYDFERPYSIQTGIGNKVKDIFPFRGAHELLDRLFDAENPARFARADDGSYSLVIHLPRQKLVNKLSQKTLVVMDATLPPVLKMLLPRLQKLCYDVPQNIHITQTTNALFSKRDLYKPETRAKVEAVNRAFAGDSKKHLTMLPMRFQEGTEALQVPAGSQVEHWGLHRATSKYSDIDSLTIVGHHLRPIDYIKAEVIAARAFAGKNSCVDGRSGDGDDNGLPAETFRLYNHIMPNGKVAGRWMKCDRNKYIQAAIDAEYACNIIQAIGRARAALRPFDRPPVYVLILCNEPVADLPVDLLTTTRELVTNPPEKQVFISNIYMKKSETGGLVPSYTDVMNGKDPWDAALVQDETAETQACEPAAWLPTRPPMLE